MYYILYNPLAGGGTGKSRSSELESKLKGDKKFVDITLIEDLPKYLKTLYEDDIIVLCGGDGTINRFVNSVDTDALENKVYYFAAGTGNDFLLDVADGKNDIVDITRYLKNLPSVTVNGKTYKFINGVGYGIDGYCCEVGDKMREEGKSNINYASIAVKGLLFGYEPKNAKITVDGKTYNYKKVWLAPTMFGRFYGGGMLPAPEQRRDNSERTVSVMVFHGSGKLKSLIIFPSIFKGEHVKHQKTVTVISGKEIKVEFDKPTALQIDGETILNVTQYGVNAAVALRQAIINPNPFLGDRFFA